MLRPPVAPHSSFIHHPCPQIALPLIPGRNTVGSHTLATYIRVIPWASRWSPKLKINAVRTSASRFFPMPLQALPDKLGPTAPAVATLEGNQYRVLQMMPKDKYTPFYI